SGTRVDQLTATETGWHLENTHTGSVATPNTVVIACAYSAKQFSQTDHLPLKKIRGQISLTNATSLSVNLKTALCGEGYIAPALGGQHCAGASFVLRTDETALSWDEHQQNLTNAAALSPVFADLAVEDLTCGRVSFRCTT